MPEMKSKHPSILHLSSKETPDFLWQSLYAHTYIKLAVSSTRTPEILSQTHSQHKPPQEIGIEEPRHCVRSLLWRKWNSNSRTRNNHGIAIPVFLFRNCNEHRSPSSSQQPIPYSDESPSTTTTSTSTSDGGDTSSDGGATTTTTSAISSSLPLRRRHKQIPQSTAAIPQQAPPLLLSSSFLPIRVRIRVLIRIMIQMVDWEGVWIRGGDEPA